MRKLLTHKIKRIYRYWIFLVFLCIFFGYVFATVTITKPTWWASVSADKAADATTPAWTALGSIVIKEQATTAGYMDFTWSQTNVTLVLSAPSSRVFNPWVWSVSFVAAKDITSASIVVTSTTATITFSTDSTPTTQDTLTIAWLQIRPVTGKLPPRLQYIMRTSANPGTAAAIPWLALNGTQLANLGMITGAIKYLVVTMPGQTFQTSIWANGTPTNQLSWVSFIIPSVTAVDQFINRQPSYVWAKTLNRVWPVGTNTYTTAVTFAAGVSTTALTTTIRSAQTTALIVKETTLYGYTGSTFIVSNPIISIGSPSSQTISSISASTSPQTVILTPSAWGDYFFVDDQKWLDAWYYTTISCSSLTAWWNSISNTNISVSTDGTVDLVSGTGNPRVTSDIGTTYQTCNNTLTFMRRNNAANMSVKWRYGQFLNVKVVVPARQTPGNYTSTITFTLIEN